MSERAGSVRDARFLSGADIGRVISVVIGARNYTGPLYKLAHTKTLTTISIGDEWLETIIDLRPHDAVTITGADN